MLNHNKKIIKDIEQQILVSHGIKLTETFWNCRNTAIDYRKPMTAKILRRIQGKRNVES